MYAFYFSGHLEQGHAGVVRPERAARAEPRDAEPPVRAVDQGRRDGAERHAPLPQKVRHHAALQAHLTNNLLMRAVNSVLLYTAHIYIVSYFFGWSIWTDRRVLYSSCLYNIIYLNCVS